MTVLTRLARFAVARRRLVLAASALFVVVAAGVGAGAFGKLQDGGFEDPDAESTRAADILEERFDDGGAPSLVLLARSPTGDVDDEDVAADGFALTEDLAAVPDVTDVVSYWSLGGAPTLRSADGAEALVLARITGGEEDEDGVVADINDRMARRDGPLEVSVGGPDAIGADITESVKASLGRAELIAIPLTLLLLLFVFRSVPAASLPLLIGLLAIMGTLLTLSVLGSITDVSVYSINITTALGLGLAIDYSLFIVSRYREELRRGLPVTDAVVRSVETAGRTVTISALTVAVSLSALLIFPLYFLRSFAYAGIAVVLLAMVAAIVTLPALLVVIGPRIESRRARAAAPAAAPGAGAGERGGSREADGFWHRVAVTVMRRPLPVAIAVTVALLFLGAPFLRLSVGLPDERVLHESSEARQVSERIQARFPGDTSAAFPVVVEGGGGPVDAGALRAYAAELSEIDGVARIEGPDGVHQDGQPVEATGPPADPARFVRDGAAWLEVVPAIEVQSGAGEQLVEDIRALDPGFATLVGGSAAQLVDTKASLLDLLPWALAIIALTTLVLLHLMTGSVLIPVKALVLNLLSLTATFGAMVWIYQDGHLSGVLDFTATGRIDTSMPILMFCIAFGLSMDYEVFLLSRIKEEYDATGDNATSVALGLERTGRIVSAAAALLAITFLAFGTAEVSFLKLFGIGLALAVLMDATVIRGLLVPAFMRLAGPANWWAPAPLRRFHQRFGTSESTPSEGRDQSGGEVR